MSPQTRLSRSEQARINGAKSHGPKTPEGKQKSSQNARKHDFFTQAALLYFESPEEFTALRDSYITEYQPHGPTEMHFIMEMANAQFRLRRVRAVEADLVRKFITRDISGNSLDDFELQAEALRNLADNSSILTLLQRYETTLRRQYERALHLLWEHRDRLASLEKQAEAVHSRQAIRNIQSFLAAPVPAHLQNEPNRPLTPACGTQSIHPPPLRSHPSTPTGGLR